jgi:hypothetical protein
MLLVGNLFSCQTVLSTLQADPRSIAFRTPVPRDVPNYYNRIRQPTDLQTIQELVTSYRLKTIPEFVAELRRMTSNAEQYWGFDHEIAATGRYLFQSALAVLQQCNINESHWGSAASSAASTPVASTPTAAETHAFNFAATPSSSRGASSFSSLGHGGSTPVHTSSSSSFSSSFAAPFPSAPSSTSSSSSKKRKVPEQSAEQQSFSLASPSLTTSASTSKPKKSRASAGQATAAAATPSLPTESRVALVAPSPSMMSFRIQMAPSPARPTTSALPELPPIPDLPDTSNLLPNHFLVSTSSSTDSDFLSDWDPLL